MTGLAAVFATAAACQEPHMPASIQDVKTRHENALLAQPGVVSVGIGRDAAGNPVIVVGLDRERPQTRQQLPKDLEGFPVQVEVVGTLRPR